MPEEKTPLKNMQAKDLTITTLLLLMLFTDNPMDMFFGRTCMGNSTGLYCRNPRQNNFHRFTDFKNDENT